MDINPYAPFISDMPVGWVRDSWHEKEARKQERELKGEELRLKYLKIMRDKGVFIVPDRNPETGREVVRIAGLQEIRGEPPEQHKMYKAIVDPETRKKISPYRMFEITMNALARGHRVRYIDKLDKSAGGADDALEIFVAAAPCFIETDPEEPPEQYKPELYIKIQEGPTDIWRGEREIWLRSFHWEEFGTLKVIPKYLKPIELGETIQL